MRVTSSAAFRTMSTAVNDVHSRLNKSLNKISSGRAYETAADNPLAYYEGKKLDNQYQTALSQSTLLTDIKNRLYQQELGARSIQETLSQAKVQVEYARNATTSGKYDIQTIQDDLLQKSQSMVNSLNMQYQDFYIYGGNDLSTPPFSLSADGSTLTYSHVFPGEDTVETFEMKLERQTDGTYQFNLDNVDMTKLKKAMSEQSRVDVGYGSLDDTSTLLDTYTGGLNLLTGLTSDAVRAMSEDDFEKAFQERINESPIALTGQAALAIGDYVDALESGTAGATDTLNDVLGSTMESMTETEHIVSTVYSDLGNKYQLLEQTETRLDLIQDSLTQQYTDKLGADPYAAIMEMYQYQNSYTAALQVSSRLMGSSLFDFMR